MKSKLTVLLIMAANTTEIECESILSPRNVNNTRIINPPSKECRSYKISQTQTV